MTAALLLVTVLVGVFFLWEGEKAVDTEMRSRALTAASNLSLLIRDAVSQGDRLEIYNTLTSRFLSNENSPYGSDLLYGLVYNRNGDLLIGSSATEIFIARDSPFGRLPSGKRIVLASATLDPKSQLIQGPQFILKDTKIYELTFPILEGNERVGFVRVGISGQHYEKIASGMTKQVAIVLFAALLVGMVFSHIITLGITRPILQLSNAAEKLSQQNWDFPLPTKGRDEISKLGDAFNQMALTLKQRELSLSRGNKDLFILHTAGLDLMESLDLESLLAKIAARAEDLVRADTTSVAIVDGKARKLTYAGVYGDIGEGTERFGDASGGGRNI